MNSVNAFIFIGNNIKLDFSYVGFSETKDPIPAVNTTYNPKNYCANRKL